MNNKIKSAFDGVHAEAELKSDTLAYIREKAEQPSAGHSRPLLALCVCLVLVLLGIGGKRLYESPIAVISVDVNPSVELGVNRFDRIVAVTAYNDDGQELAAALDINNMPYSDGLELLVNSPALRPYLDGGGLLSITVVGDSDGKAEEMLARIEGCGYASGENVECRRGDRAELAGAHEAGLSYGKYLAYLELSALDPDISVDDIRELTMRQIRERISELSGNSNDTHPGSTYGQGGGNQYGRK